MIVAFPAVLAFVVTAYIVIGLIMVAQAADDARRGRRKRIRLMRGIR